MTPVFLFVDLLEEFFSQPPLSLRRQSLVAAANELAALAGEKPGEHAVVELPPRYDFFEKGPKA